MSAQQIHQRLRRRHWNGRPFLEVGWSCIGTVTGGERTVGIWSRIKDGAMEQRMFRWNGRKWKPVLNMVRLNA